MTRFAWELTRYGTTIFVDEDNDGAHIGTFGKDGTVHGIDLDIRDVMRVRDALDDCIVSFLFKKQAKSEE